MTLNQLLVELDGYVYLDKNVFYRQKCRFTPNEGIIVIAATNFPDILDPALTRPGFVYYFTVSSTYILTTYNLLTTYYLLVKTYYLHLTIYNLTT